MPSRVLLASICLALIMLGLALATASGPAIAAPMYQGCDENPPAGPTGVSWIGNGTWDTVTDGDSVDIEVSVPVSVTRPISIVLAWEVCADYPQSGWESYYTLQCPNGTAFDVRLQNEALSRYIARVSTGSGCDVVCSASAVESFNCPSGYIVRTLLVDDGTDLNVHIQKPCSSFLCETTVKWAVGVMEDLPGVQLYYPLIYTDTASMTQAFNPPTHNGVDWGVTEGRPVFSVWDGVVADTGYDPDVKGYYVQIDHGELADGYTYSSYYYHLSAVNVEVSDYISATCQLGWSGNTGYSTGPHLHLGLKRNDAWADPMIYMVNYPYWCALEESCCSDCGFTNSMFLDGLDYWDTYNVSWSASGWPNEGVVNFLSGGYVAQDITIPSGVTRTVSARVRSANDAEVLLQYGGVIVGRQNAPDDNEWHVLSFPIAGNGSATEIKVSNAPFPGNVYTIDWVCIGVVGQGGGTTPPTPDENCNLENYTFLHTLEGWNYNAGVSSGGGGALLDPGGEVSQTISVSSDVIAVQVVARSVGGSALDVYLDGYGARFEIPASGTWYPVSLVPSVSMSGTMPVIVRNVGSYQVDIDYVCVLTYGTGPYQPPIPGLADCDEYWPGDDWFNVGKWILWLECILVGWLLALWQLLLSLTGMGSSILSYIAIGLGILGQYQLWFSALIVGWSTYLFGDFDYFWPHLENAIALFQCWLGGAIVGASLLVPVLAQQALDAVGVGLAILEAITGLPFGSFWALLRSAGEALAMALNVLTSGSQAIFDSLNSSAIAELGLPDPENTAHPLYPFWIGITLFDDVVADTPLQYAAVIAMGITGLRLILWSIQMLTDW